MHSMKMNIGVFDMEFIRFVLGELYGRYFHIGKYVLCTVNNELCFG